LFGSPRAKKSITTATTTNGTLADTNHDETTHQIQKDFLFAKQSLTLPCWRITIWLELVFALMPIG
jgi:hypothetical protein